MFAVGDTRVQPLRGSMREEVCASFSYNTSSPTGYVRAKSLLIEKHIKIVLTKSAGAGYAD